MPISSIIRDLLGIDSTTPYAIEFKIIAHKDNPRKFYLGYYNNEYYTYDWNGNYQNFTMNKGDSFTVLVISDGSSTWAQIINQQA